MTPIEEYFRKYDDGEFCAVWPESPHYVIGPAQDDARVLYTTKWHCFSKAIIEHGPPPGMGVISSYGIPNSRDAAWLRDVVGKRQLLFCGDLDPPDIMIFAWLRSALAPTAVHYLGFSDAMEDRLGIRVPDCYRIELAKSESEAIARLEEFIPDWQSLVGPRSAAILRANQKIELEAVVSELGSQAPMLKTLAILSYREMETRLSLIEIA